MLTLLIVGTAGLVGLKIWGGQLLSVQTASMSPTIQPKDAVIVKPTPADELHVGDIISYHSPNQPKMVITHRVISIDRQARQLITAGDALHTKDPSFSEQLLVGRVVALTPRLGLIIDFLHRPIGLISAIYLPAALIIASEVDHIAYAYARPFYSVRL